MHFVVEFLKYLLLGVVQGFTEPLPISSSGHLVIIQVFLNMPNVDYFMEITLHFASLLAILILFRKRVSSLVIGVWRYVIKRDKNHAADFRYFLLIIVGVLPAALIGLFFKSLFEDFLTLLAVGISLLITGVFLLFVQRQSIENTETNIGYKDALFIGLFQVFALFPGISRSGSTFVGGLFRKIRFEALIEYSFMLYIPISLGAMVLEATQTESIQNHHFSLVAVAFIASGLATYFAFKWFVGMVKQGNLKYFGFYCFAAGSLAILFSFLV